MVQTVPVHGEDDEFLFRLYASTRRDEVSAWGWDSAQQDDFLWMQYRVRSQSYRWQYPGADHRIIRREGAAAGAMIVCRNEAEILLVDIALLPECRGSGLGTQVVRELQAEAAAAGKPLRLHVDFANPGARRLYERLGFVATGQNGTHYAMEWRAS